MVLGLGKNLSISKIESMWYFFEGGIQLAIITGISGVLPEFNVGFLKLGLVILFFMTKYKK